MPSPSKAIGRNKVRKLLQNNPDKWFTIREVCDRVPYSTSWVRATLLRFISNSHRFERKELYTRNRPTWVYRYRSPSTPREATELPKKALTLREVLREALRA